MGCCPHWWAFETVVFRTLRDVSSHDRRDRGESSTTCTLIHRESQKRTENNGGRMMSRFSYMCMLFSDRPPLLDVTRSSFAEDYCSLRKTPLPGTNTLKRPGEMMAFNAKLRVQEAHGPSQLAVFISIRSTCCDLLQYSASYCLQI